MLLSNQLIVAFFATVPAVIAQQCPSSQAKYPKVFLPWGTVTATSCDNSSNVYTFSNIRFGKDTASFRFTATTAPDPVSQPAGVILDQSSGPACPQTNPGILTNCSSPSGSALIAPHQGPSLLFPGDASQPQSEDCMFLDIYAPVSAFVHSPSDANLPVIVWFYGGAYISGSKDWGTFNMTAPKTPYEPDAPVPFYDGTAVVQTASSVGSGAIFVTGNYRLGALGWLAGPTITSSSKAKANVGLLDQQLLLQFVTQNIAGFGGNNETITAWGESAGAGSIMHHLIAYGGQKNPPPFTNALLQSAAFEWQWDNRPATGPDHGALDVQFEAFLSAANCNGTGDTAITCLQGLSYEDILRAQANFFEGAGCSGVGPAVDGELILELPATAFENNRAHAINSIIASHVDDEAAIFVPKGNFSSVLNSFLPSALYDEAKTNITERYCPAHPNCSADDIKTLIRDAIFTCNTRYIYDFQSAQNKSIFMLHYGVGENIKGKDVAYHATDLIPTFLSPETDISTLANRLAETIGDSPDTYSQYLNVLIKPFYANFQQYLVSHAITGNPNYKGEPVTWNAPTEQQDLLGNVMDVHRPILGTYFHPNFTDHQNGASACSQFWPGIAQWVQDTAKNSTTGVRHELVVQDPRVEL